MQLAVVGLGYVGLVTATCLARLGQQVIGLEVDEGKLRTLRAGEVPYYEPHLHAELTAQQAGGRLEFTDDPRQALHDAEVILICVGTPSDPTGHADLGAILAVVDSIGDHVDGDTLVVIRSTVPVGTTRVIEERLNRRRAERGLPSVPVFANPEFLRTGRALDDFLRPTRVIVGMTDLATDAHLGVLATLYAPLEAPFLVTDAGSAELVKNASNAFLAMRVSFVNELAALCDVAGAEIDDVVAGMALDPRIGGQFMKPGIGYGGSCLPKDVRSLIATGEDRGVDMRLAKAVDAVNVGQPDRVLDEVERRLGRPLAGSCIALLGLAFKPDTDDIRDSPALAIADRLHDRDASVVACDPEAGPKAVRTRPWLELADHSLSAASGADAVVLATEWPAYVTADLDAMREVMRGTLIVDGRNALDPSKVRAAGLDYLGVGRPAVV